MSKFFSVPRLDLSLFNQPDEQMAPIEILNTASTCCQRFAIISFAAHVPHYFIIVL